jgi:hypothetical protein
VIGQYFKDIQTISHRVSDKLGPTFRPEDWRPNYNEQDFKFPLETLQDMYRACPMTTVFLVRTAREEQTIPPTAKPMRFVDDSFTRPEGYIDPKIRWRLSQYFPSASPADVYKPGPLDLVEKALFIARIHGPQVMLREVGRFIKYTLKRTP